MTQEDKKLLLKVLCAMLPYGFTIHRYSDNCDIIIESNGIDAFSHFLEYSEGEDFKPYLRPLSSMTEKEKEEYHFYCDNYYDVYFDSIESIDWLNARHFDYYGLIEKGLALEAPEGMYNLKD